MARLFSTAAMGIMTIGLVACGGAKANQDAADPSSNSADAEDSSAKSDTEAAGETPRTKSGKELPPVGTQNLDTRSLSMEFGLTLLSKGNAAGVQTGNWSFEEERTHRVKALGSNGVDELEVVYGKWDAKPLLGLVYEVPTDGKTYLIKAGDDEASVTRSHDAPMTSDELEAVLGEYGYVGELPPTLTAIDASENGSNVEVSPAFIRSIIGAIPGVKHDESEMTAKFLGIGADTRKAAKLELTLICTLRSGETSFELSLKGPAAVDVVTGWVDSVNLEGTLTPSGKVKVSGKMLDVRGKGTAKYTRSVSFK